MYPEQYRPIAIPIFSVEHSEEEEYSFNVRDKDYGA